MIRLKDLASSKNVVVAEESQGFLIQLGSSYDAYHFIQTKDLEYRELKKRIDTFIKYARARPGQKFWVTSSLGAAVDIAPMLVHAPYNCVLPTRYRDIIGVDDKREWWRA